MLEIDIPGYNRFRFEHLVLDFNGTIAIDGVLIDGVVERLKELSKYLHIHILTADTNKSVESQLCNTNFNVHIIGVKKQDIAKLDYITKLGKQSCICFGNGANDRLMLENCGLGICVLQKEGAYTMSLNASKIVVLDIRDGLDLILKKNRLVATMRL